MIYVIMDSENNIIAIYTEKEQAEKDIIFLKNITCNYYYILTFVKTNENRYEKTKEEV